MSTRVRLCDINNQLQKSLVAMVQRMPENPMIRSQVHAALKFPIPEDRLTYEQIRDWIEYDWPILRDAAKKNPLTCVAMDTDLLEPQLGGVDLPASYMEGEDLPGIDAVMRYAYTDVGNCRFREDRSGTGDYTMEGRQVLEILNISIEAGENFDAFLGRIETEFKDMCLEDTPETEANGDIDHEDHETTDSTNHRASFTNATQLRTDMIRWIREYRPDYADALRMTGL